MRKDYAYTSMRKFETVVDTYLSANFLNKIPKNTIFIEDTELQYRGADISCDNGNIIDCKIKNTKTINEIFQYPSVEISIKHNKHDGWFVKKDSITTTYFFISVFSTQDWYENITVDNISKLNVLIFSKNQLKKYIEQFVSLEQIKEDALYLDEYRQRKDYYNKFGNKVMHLKYSPYNEGAINLVLKRDVYLSLPFSKEIEITKDNIKRITNK